MAQLAKLVESEEKQELLSDLYSPQAQAVLGVLTLFDIGIMLEQQDNYNAAEQIYRRILQVPLDQDPDVRDFVSSVLLFYGPSVLPSEPRGQTRERGRAVSNPCQSFTARAGGSR